MRRSDHEHDADVAAGVRPRRPSRSATPEVPPAGMPLGPREVVSLQRLAGNAGVAGMLTGAAVEDSLSTPGEPLDGGVRSEMEQRLGGSFGDVRIHRDDAAHRSAESVAARAYTSGNHIVFQRDAYDPHSASGRHTLAHELHHVLQQRSGPVEGRPTSAGFSVSSPDDRHEREAVEVATRALQAPVPGADDVQREQDGTAGTGAAVQREAAEEQLPEDEA